VRFSRGGGGDPFLFLSSLARRDQPTLARHAENSAGDERGRFAGVAPCSWAEAGGGAAAEPREEAAEVPLTVLSVSGDDELELELVPAKSARP